MTPLKHYRQQLSRDDFAYDEAQSSMVNRLEALYQQLIAEQPLKDESVVSHTEAQRIKGLYIWGPVGRGKTYLMDSFFDSLPVGMGMRLHFHRFMKRVHKDLTLFSGQKNPLDLVAKHIAVDAKVLCFDEFFVADIGDAMIMANLLKALFELGVVLVATSNVEVGDLYRDGLQRDRFLPAIAQLTQYTQIVALDGGEDHRLRSLHHSPNYFTPLGERSGTQLMEGFESQVKGAWSAGRTIDISGREIPTIRNGENIVWFDFMALCDGPRSQLDYIEISQRYETVIVSDVPVLGGGIDEKKIAIGTEDSRSNAIGFVNRTIKVGKLDDPARRFIALVDEFYDSRVKLMVSAAAPIDQLYRGGRVSFEFQRTVSRLIEMQSQEYNQLCHSM